MDIEIKPGLKVSLDGENGVVINSDTEDFNAYGIIRWDSDKDEDLEDWRGVFGTLFDMGLYRCILHLYKRVVTNCIR